MNNSSDFFLPIPAKRKEGREGGEGREIPLSIFPSSRGRKGGKKALFYASPGPEKKLAIPNQVCILRYVGTFSAWYTVVRLSCFLFLCIIGHFRFHDRRMSAARREKIKRTLSPHGYDGGGRE